MNCAINTSSLNIGYGKNVILKNIDIKLEYGTTAALIGCNGVGKSTLLKTLTGELQPIGGNVSIDGTSISSLTKKQLALKMAIVTTQMLQTGGLRVREVVGMGRHPHSGIFAHLSSTDLQIIEDAMQSVDILFKADSYMADLSDGERQKAMIARALAQDTPIIVLDEPLSFLDPASRIEIITLLKTQSQKRNKAIVFSTHDVAQAVRMADNIILITASGEIHQNTPAQIIASGQINNLFSKKRVIFDIIQNDFVPL